MRPEKVQKILNTLPINSWAYPRILLAIPMERTLSYADKVFIQFMQIAAQGVALLKKPYTRTDIARNNYAMALLESDYTHVLMLDSDHIHPVDIVQRLARWVLLRPDVQVVGGLNFRRSEPYEPCAFFLDENNGVSTIGSWGEGIIKVDALGTGSMLIAREVFETIEPPWFYNIYDENYWSDIHPGEDIGFALKCREAGIGQWVDTTTTSPHVTEGLITEAAFRRYQATHPGYYKVVPSDAEAKDEGGKDA